MWKANLAIIQWESVGVILGGIGALLGATGKWVDKLIQHSEERKIVELRLMDKRMRKIVTKKLKQHTVTEATLLKEYKEQFVNYTNIDAQAHASMENRINRLADAFNRHGISLEPPED